MARESVCFQPCPFPVLSVSSLLKTDHNGEIEAILKNKFLIKEKEDSWGLEEVHGLSKELYSIGNYFDLSVLMSRW